MDNSRVLKPIRGVSAAIALACLVLVGATAVSHAQAIKGGDPKAAAVKNPVAANANSINRGQQSYMKACRHCHGPKGLGDGPLAPKGSMPSNLTDSDWTFGSSDGEIYTVIANGVGGDSPMKGVRSQMTATDMWNIVNYLRSLGPQAAK
jgi:mono/diheme cytochrome c family protein